jgi:hypothetical protein
MSLLFSSLPFVPHPSDHGPPFIPPRGCHMGKNIHYIRYSMQGTIQAVRYEDIRVLARFRDNAGRFLPSLGMTTHALSDRYDRLLRWSMPRLDTFSPLAIGPSAAP